MSDFDLSGRRAVVTGGSSGMGAEIAVQMAAAGAAVAVVGRDEERLAEVAARVTSAGGTAHAIARDITDPGAEHVVIAEAVAQLGGIDVLTHVAGIFETAPMEQLTADSFDRQVATNVRAPFLLTQAALSHLKESSHGVLLFVTSLAALAGMAECSAYAASKGALEAMSRALAVELAADGIRVNSLAPGDVDTPMNEVFYREHPEYIKEIEGFTPAGRVGRPDDIAPVAVFLASEASKFVYGASIPVDGGVLAR